MEVVPVRGPVDSLQKQVQGSSRLHRMAVGNETELTADSLQKQMHSA